MALDLITDVGVAVLLVVGVILCAALTIAVVKLLPPLLNTARNLEKVTSDLAAVSGDVAQDIAKTAQNTAAASENAVESSQNLVNATGDFAEAAANVAAISRLDIRAILVQVAGGNITNVKELAGFVGRNIPQAASRVRSLFRRGGE